MASPRGLPASCLASDGRPSVAEYQRACDALSDQIATRGAEDGPCPLATRFIGAQQYAFIRLNALKMHGEQGWRLSDLALDPDWVAQSIVWENIISVFAEQDAATRWSRLEALICSWEEDDEDDDTSSSSSRPNSTPPTSPDMENSPTSSTASQVQVEGSLATIQASRVSRYIALLDAVADECDEWMACSWGGHDFNHVYRAPFTPVVVPPTLEQDILEHHDAVFNPNSPGARRRRAIRATRKTAPSEDEIELFVQDSNGVESVSPSERPSLECSSSRGCSDGDGIDQSSPSRSAVSPLPTSTQHSAMREFKGLIHRVRGVACLQLLRRV